jgi:hypothetical protein
MGKVLTIEAKKARRDRALDERIRELVGERRPMRTVFAAEMSAEQRAAYGFGAGWEPKRNHRPRR